MRSFPLVIFTVLFLSGQTVGQAPDYDGEQNWHQVCEQSKSKSVEQPQLHGPLAQDKLATCDETALYYGFSDKPDYSAALQCGWYQHAHPQKTIGNMFYGPGVLTMLYANGEGVPRDYDRAIRFACEEYWAAPAEMGLRIGHLERLRATDDKTGSFDLCDDITSGLSMGFCTRIGTRAADAQRDTKIAAIVAGLSADAKSRFIHLQSAQADFEKAHSSNEVDLSGTARAMFELEEEKMQRDQFLINLQRFGKGDIPQASAADLADLDRQLNDVYQQIQQAPASSWEWGTIRSEGIRDTERKWLALTEAWLNFARAAYPGLSATRIHAQLIRLRLHQLRSLAR
jgi:hypothetical protein